MQGMLHSLKHLALIAMILRALLPTGWMPSQAVDAPFTICTIDASHQQDPGNKVPDPSSHHDKPCAFSSAPQLAATPDIPSLILPAVHGFAARSDRAYAIRIAAHHQPHSPRAPPLNA
jgi:hypothetical protein